MRLLSSSVSLFIATLIALGVAPVALVLVDLQDHDAQRLVQLALLAVSAGLAIDIAGKSGTSLFRRYPRWIGVSLVVIGVASVVHAPVPRAALLELGLLLSLAVFAVGIRCSVASVGVHKMLLIPVVASLTFAFSVAVRYTATLTVDAPLLREQLLPAYSNYRFYNHVQTVTIPLILAAAMMGAQRYGLRYWAVVALVIEFCLLFFTGGRATIVALCAATLVVGILFGRRAFPWIVRLGMAAILGAALYFLLFTLIPMLLGMTRDYFATDIVSRSEAGVGGPREYLWTLAWSYIRESPWFGIGPMHFAHRVNDEAAHPHNIYLQVAAEWGVPAAVLVLVLAVRGWHRVLHVAKRSESEGDLALGLSLVAISVAIAVDGFFSGNFVMPYSQLWIAFAIGLCAAYVSRHGGAHVAEASKLRSCSAVRTRLPLIALALTSLAAVWQGVWPEIKDVQAHVDKVRDEVVHNVRDNPRFWSHGWFR